MINHGDKWLSDWCQLCCCPLLIDCLWLWSLTGCEPMCCFFWTEVASFPLGAEKQEPGSIPFKLCCCCHCQAFPLQDMGLGAQWVVQDFSTGSCPPKNQEMDILCNEFKFKFHSFDQVNQDCLWNCCRALVVQEVSPVGLCWWLQMLRWMNACMHLLWQILLGILLHRTTNLMMNSTMQSLICLMQRNNMMGLILVLMVMDSCVREKIASHCSTHKTNLLRQIMPPQLLSTPYLVVVSHIVNDPWLCPNDKLWNYGSKSFCCAKSSLQVISQSGKAEAVLWVDIHRQDQDYAWQDNTILPWCHSLSLL